MRKNCYLWTSGVNLDTTIRFPDPDFFIKCKILAIFRRFSFIFAFYMLKIHHIFTSGFFDLLIDRHGNNFTRISPHGDKPNFRQVWSWYDDPLLSYSVLAYDTSRAFVTLTFDLLTLNSCHTRRVTCPTLPPSLKTLCLFVLELWVTAFPIGYHWKCVRGHNFYSAYFSWKSVRASWQ